MMADDQVSSRVDGDMSQIDLPLQRYTALLNPPVDVHHYEIAFRLQPADVFDEIIPVQNGWSRFPCFREIQIGCVYRIHIPQEADAQSFPLDDYRPPGRVNVCSGTDVFYTERIEELHSVEDAFSAVIINVVIR